MKVSSHAFVLGEVREVSHWYPWCCQTHPLLGLRDVIDAARNWLSTSRGESNYPFTSSRKIAETCELSLWIIWRHQVLGSRKWLPCWFLHQPHADGYVLLKTPQWRCLSNVVVLAGGGDVRRDWSGVAVPAVVRYHAQSLRQQENSESYRGSWHQLGETVYIHYVWWLMADLWLSKLTCRGNGPGHVQVVSVVAWLRRS